MYPQYPPALTDEQHDYLLTNLKDWSIAHGLAVRPATTYVPDSHNPSGSLATAAPVTLFPSLFPRVCYEQALSVAEAYSELYSAIASDEDWLKSIIEELIEIDDFISGLWKIHLSVKEEGYTQPLTLGLFRSDYMVHTDKHESGSEATKSQPTIKQVEFNTIASSFGGLSAKVCQLHQHLRSIDAYPETLTSAFPPSSNPTNTSIPSLAAGLAKAHTAYETASPSPRPKCILFIVQDPENNVFDQRHLEYQLQTHHHIRVFRVPFSRILTTTSLLPTPRRELIYTPPHNPTSTPFEVSTIYFRAGYSPAEYTTPTHWTSRLHLERSAAIKCPSILTQLAGTKKVQQVLATPSSPHLSTFLPSTSSATAILATFVPQYPLDKTPAGLTAEALATNPASAQRFVLKPQREGGGNNIYRGTIPGFLAKLPRDHWPAYILMEMIEPPAQENVIFRNGQVQQGGVICELGVYGACLWDASGKGAQREILYNAPAGYLLRTKGDQSEEGGVAAGFGAVDSLCLVDV